MSLFSGLSAFPITPADENGRVDLAALGVLLERLADAEVTSVGLLGSTGGYAYLTREERKRAVGAAAVVLKNRVPLIVSVGAIRTDAARLLAKDAKTEGADGLLLAPVSYTPLTQEEVFQHFQAVASATDLPLCIYNNPSTTHFSFSPQLLQRLAKLPTIKAVKMPLPQDGNFRAAIASLREKAPEDFAVGYSGDWGCAEALLAGADGWFSVIGGILPEPAMKLADAARNGDRAETDRLNSHFEPLWGLFQEFGSLRVVYAVMNLLGISDAQPHRPLLPLKACETARITAALETLAKISDR